MADEQKIVERKGQEGSRWINERPSGDEVAKWFLENVPMADEGLNPQDYLPGVTLIQQSETSKEVVGFRDNGSPIIQDEIKNLVYVPYVKVETRVQYFHDLMSLNASEWEGVIEPVSVPKQDPDLPPGFFYMLVREAENKVVRFICCSMKVTVFKRGTIETKRVLLNSGRHGSEARYETYREGETIIDAPPGTKMVPVRGRYGADANAIMKAQTGAVGRALGLAGMLIVPGTGVATAEDLQEAQAMEGTRPQAEPDAAAPAQEGSAAIALAEPSIEELRNQATRLVRELQEDQPERYEKFIAWCREKKFDGKISELPEAGVKGVIKKVEKELDEAKQAQQG